MLDAVNTFTVKKCTACVLEPYFMFKYLTILIRSCCNIRHKPAERDEP